MKPQKRNSANTDQITCVLATIECSIFIYQSVDVWLKKGLVMTIYKNSLSYSKRHQKPNIWLNLLPYDTISVKHTHTITQTEIRTHSVTHCLFPCEDHLPNDIFKNNGDFRATSQIQRLLRASLLSFSFRGIMFIFFKTAENSSWGRGKRVMVVVFGLQNLRAFDLGAEQRKCDGEDVRTVLLPPGGEAGDNGC